VEPADLPIPHKRFIISVTNCKQSYFCVSQGMRRHYSGEVGESTIADVKFPQDSVHQKVLSRFIVRRSSYSKDNEGGGAFCETQCILLSQS